MSSSSIPNYVFIKENVSLREYKMYKYLNDKNLSFIPKIYQYNNETKVLTTQKIMGLSVADFYGEDFNLVPEKIISQIRDIIRYLYKIGVIYPDITGYNFIVDKKSKVWIIDFEHSFYTNQLQSMDNTILDDIPDKNQHIDFVEKFSNSNENAWNAYFA
jgi:RIO-like serine/threonine protein kinase